MAKVTLTGLRYHWVVVGMPLMCNVVCGGIKSGIGVGVGSGECGPGRTDRLWVGVLLGSMVGAGGGPDQP